MAMICIKGGECDGCGDCFEPLEDEKPDRWSDEWKEREEELLWNAE